MGKSVKRKAGGVKKSLPEPSPSSSKKSKQLGLVPDGDEGSSFAGKSVPNGDESASLPGNPVLDDDVNGARLPGESVPDDDVKGVCVAGKSVPDGNEGVSFVGKPVPDDEARQRWPQRYQPEIEATTKGDSSLPKNSMRKKGESEEEGEGKVLRHYTQALVDGFLYNLSDDVYVKGEDKKPNYIAKIVEFFESSDQELYFTAQWFYRPEDTVMDHVNIHKHVDIGKQRVFISDVRNDNPLECIVSKVKIVKIEPNLNLAAKNRVLAQCDFYYNMKYSVPFSTFSSIVNENLRSVSDTSSTISCEACSTSAKCDLTSANSESSSVDQARKPEMALLDLFAGCGAMSTGLCLGAYLSDVKLVTRWAVDYNAHACETLRLNHPETEVRHEKAEDFLALLKEWVRLCDDFKVAQSLEQDVEEEDEDISSPVPRGEFEVGKIVAICYGDPNKDKSGLHFKVRWKGYGPSDDTWEPKDNLSKCNEKIKEFVKKGYKSNIIPLPGDVDLICGGPPCQGASGFNRYRNVSAPLDDPRNYQLKVFMDIVEHLKPHYVLMENVVDILNFAEGLLGRFALGRLVAMDYQARLGIMAAGSYGLPQYRQRVFLWGAWPTEKLPQYVLPTHHVITRGGIPTKFQDNHVSYDIDEPQKLENALFLKDAISDLPAVANDECEDERLYGTAAETEFQKYIRLSKCDLVNCTADALQTTSSVPKLYDHCPLQLNQDDFERVCKIPKQKGANFRNLPGVLVNSVNQVYWDPSMERLKLASGKYLVPPYAMSFINGKSLKPFGRLWWDETVSTVVTRAEPHNQAIIHPEQDRVLSVRENARLQGFPDCYKLCGPMKERYMQVGNAVAVPVSLALGYSFGRACKGVSNDEPLMTLPFTFPSCLARQSSEQNELRDNL